MKETDELKEFVEGLEMTVLTEEDSILLDGMVGTSGTTEGSDNGCNIGPTDTNCSDAGCPTTNNCNGGNCVAGCGD